jgi:type I restriction enzyme S subunit
MNPLLQTHFETALDHPNGIKKLRELILSLAMQGKLVVQDPNDQPARELLKEIQAEKERLVKEGKIKKTDALPPIKEEEKPFVLPEGWEWVRLGEVGSWRSGSTPTRSNSSYFIGKIPWVKSGEVKQRLIRDTEEKISDEAFRKFSLPLIAKNSILIAMYGANIGEVGVLEIDATTNQAVCACTPFENIDCKYLLIFIESRRNYYLGMSAGAAQPNISREKIINTPLPLPPLAEQKRIIEKVDQLFLLCDELERLQQSRNSKRKELHNSVLTQCLEADSVSSFQTSFQFLTTHFHELYSVKENVKELRKAVLQLAVMGKLVPQDKNDQPARELLKEIQAEKERLVKEGKIRKGNLIQNSLQVIPRNIFPENWKIVKADEIFFITKLAGFEYSKNINLQDHGDIPVIRAQNVRPFKLDLNNLKFIDYKTSELLDRCALTKKCLLVTFIGAGIGDVGLFAENRRWHLAPNVAKMEPFFNSEEKLNLRYINIYLMSEIGRIEIFKHMKSTAQPSISMGTIRDIDIPIPPLAEQKRIVEKVDELLALCDRLEEEIEKAESKRGEILEGMVRV